MSTRRPGPATRPTCLPPPTHAPCPRRRPERSVAPPGEARERNRGKRRTATRWGKNRQAKTSGWPSAAALGSARRERSQAPPSQSPRPAPPKTGEPRAGWGNDEAPAPRTWGTGVCLPSPVSATRPLGAMPPTAVTQEGALGTGNDAAARPRAPETTWSAPGAPRRARRNALGTPRRRAARRRGRPSPPRGGPLATHSRERPARVSAASVDPGPAGAVRGGPTGGRGRAGVRTPLRHLPNSARGRGGGAWEARRQNEKSGPIHQECPSLV